MILNKTYDKIFKALLNNNPKAKEMFLDFYKKLPEDIKQNLRKDVVCESHIEGKEFSLDIGAHVNGYYGLLITDNSLVEDTCALDIYDIDADEIEFVSDDEPFDGHSICADLATLSFSKAANIFSNGIYFDFDIICRKDGYHLVSAYTIYAENPDEEDHTNEVFDTKIDLNDFIIDEERKLQN